MSDTYETLRTWIIRGALEPNQRLLEAQLADQLKISRTPIREALRRLEIEGLIRFTPNRGAVVRSYSVDEINHIFNLRVLLEGFAAQQAAYNRNDQHGLEIIFLIEQFKDLYEQVKTDGILEGHVDKFVEINQKFHHLIWNASENPQLPYILDRLMVIPLIYKSYHKYTYEQVGNSLTAHTTIGNAVIHKDPVRAEIAMKEHILVGRDHAFSFLI
ncbi:GntR family transcriptional regulator [Aneurinibacillus sp. Ricciae_BoGa-3]|uniref:GntR family transcriptional regulator n=1 Tax=Aneurinibacillus sp. Ricciae_BoGa-3 TaxID=3022697 RepID=UPI0023418CC1|nr:GntR family transcriptional regulator [Aneurinibacillus sp. Ricciae_BoGa-3]WCK55255.1 GntR family transcriptional regulator [Aneurinibacillus sp. Ricciae_BoGa-3]